MYHVIFQINSASRSKVAQHAVIETRGTESEIYSVITEEPREEIAHHTSKVAQHAIMETPGTESEIYSVITEEPREEDTHQPSTVQVPYYVHEQNTTSNELLVVITQNQERIMKKLAEISVQLEEIKENRRPFVCTLGEARGPQKEKFTIEPITKVEELERFNDQLADFDIFESFLQKYSILCSASRGSGFNCAYRLLDALFSRKPWNRC